MAVESFTDEDHHHEKDHHDDGHGFGFNAVFQPRAHRFVRSADAEAGYGGYGLGGLGLGYGNVLLLKVTRIMLSSSRRIWRTVRRGSLWPWLR